MDIIEAIKARKSIRCFLPKPVPADIIREILEIAVRSPSAMNTQPWEFTVVSGEAIETIKKENIETLLSGASPFAESDYQGIYKKRWVELAVDIFNLMDITREDSKKRSEWLQRGFRFFDAPAAVIISADQSLTGTFSLFDIGAVCQTICLAALNYGLGTCINGQCVVFPETVRKHTGIPDNKVIIIGIAIGYPDPSFPANQLVSRREPVDSITSWVGGA